MMILEDGGIEWVFVFDPEKCVVPEEALAEFADPASVIPGGVTYSDIDYSRSRYWENPAHRVISSRIEIFLPILGEIIERPHQEGSVFAGRSEAFILASVFVHEVLHHAVYLALFEIGEENGNPHWAINRMCGWLFD